MSDPIMTTIQRWKFNRMKMLCEAAITWYLAQQERPRNPAAEGLAWIAFRKACKKFLSGE